MESKIVEEVLTGRDTIDGAGVKLKRMFQGSLNYQKTDPFLLCDIFGSGKVEDYIAGFPWHPHRGIETVTYLWSGKVDHIDSEGHGGTIFPGDLQWMKAGSGIFHQEMPHPLDATYKKFNPEYDFPLENMSGVQLWINIPSNEKMSKPSYAGILRKDIPREKNGNGTTVSIVSGLYNKVDGYYTGNKAINPTYLEIKMAPEATFDIDFRSGHRVIAITLEADFLVNGSKNTKVGSFQTVLFGTEGKAVSIKNGQKESTFILISGRPLNEPVSWYGPIVMNTKDQITQAMSDLKNGTFIQEKNPLSI